MWVRKSSLPLSPNVTPPHPTPNCSTHPEHILERKPSDMNAITGGNYLDLENGAILESYEVCETKACRAAGECDRDTNTNPPPASQLAAS